MLPGLRQCSRRASAYIATSQPCRSYAISVKPAIKFPYLPEKRVFSGRKAFLYKWYRDMVDSSHVAPVLIFNHIDFTVEQLVRLRREINDASKRAMKPLLTPDSPPHASPTFTVVRSSILGATLRDYPKMRLRTIKEITEDVSGPMALLAFPTFEPTELAAVLRALDRAFPLLAPKTAEELKKEEQERNKDPVSPGKAVQRVRAVKTPQLKLVGAIIDRQIAIPDRVKEASTLPSLETLRKQIVGLLSAPSYNLAMVLSEAAGGQLARTLDGFRMSLEKGESPTRGSP
ncbi:hypothetical protein FISHEDRAFT_38806 [Fistulina hepatica ATCC 64428]|uniref:Ribosomal protein L10 n=1 Tax=Fistulina hepatica ATCC 64428 TaxID=1128425 RepID=A0A0D7AI22_9AGAR|nr:hypothetical protein FISHEDRAFT_38806 [Fistulina hepatica ATCC 64428]